MKFFQVHSKIIHSFLPVKQVLCWAAGGREGEKDIDFFWFTSEQKALSVIINFLDLRLYISKALNGCTSQKGQYYFPGYAILSRGNVNQIGQYYYYVPFSFSSTPSGAYIYFCWILICHAFSFLLTPRLLIYKLLKRNEQEVLQSPWKHVILYFSIL